MIPVKEWLETKYAGREKTQEQYGKALLAINSPKTGPNPGFFPFIGKTDVEYFAELEKIPDHDDRITKLMDDYERWLNTKLLKLAPKSRGAYTTAFRQYFKARKNRIGKESLAFDDEYWEDIYNLKMDGRQALTRRDTPKNQAELREIFRWLPHHIEVYCMALVSTGARPGEPFKIRIQEMDFNHPKFRTFLKATRSKGKKAKPLFFHEESRELIKAWVKILQEQPKVILDMINRANNIHLKTNAEQRVKDGYLFPFSYEMARRCWRDAIKKAGKLVIDADTNLSTMSLRSLRRYNYTHLKDINESLAHAILGHGGYLKDEYDATGYQEMEDFHTKGEEELTVYHTGVKKKELATVQAKLNDTTELLKDEMLDKKDLRSQLNLLARKVEAMEKEKLEDEKQAVAEKWTNMFLFSKTLGHSNNIFSEYLNSLPADTEADRKKIYEFFLEMVNRRYELDGITQTGLTPEQEKEYEELVKKAKDKREAG